ncbi:MAG: hypothetical protein DHS20C16_32290 [Phycisphaerae bacterium]|nr:MAG: hypothetical protein DHS20C16_32290 [Phycisphaerae bacterium]
MSVIRSHYDSRRVRAIVLMCCLAFSGGCKEAGDESAESESKVKPVVQEVDRGPIRLTVTADRDKISIAEQLELRIEVTADAGIDVTMPKYGAIESQFQIRDYREKAVEILDDDLRRYTHIYTLDSFLSGSYAIAGVTVAYVDRRNETANDKTDVEVATAELTTEPITVEVTSLLEGEFDPANFRDVKAAVELPVDRTWGWVGWTAGIVGGVVILAVAAVLLIRKYGRGGRPVVVIPPHEWAFAQLKALASSGLIDAGEFKPFYYRLNEITRTYIELRFGLMAPERTTEEFLEEMRSSDALDQSHQAHLHEFLTACDMVKYTLYEPSSSEIEAVFNAARDFVDRTKPGSGVAIDQGTNNEPAEVAA